MIRSISALRLRLLYLIFGTETVASRLFLGFGSAVWAVLLLSMTGANAPSSYVGMFRLTPPDIWGALFACHGIATIAAVVWDVRSRMMLVLDGILGCALWSAAALLHWGAQGAPGPLCAPALLAIWILIRFQTDGRHAGR